MNADSQWQLAGNAAELYESVLVPTVFKPWAVDLVALAELRQGERVLDVACAPASWRDSQPKTSGRRARSRGWISTRACYSWLAPGRSLQEHQ